MLPCGKTEVRKRGSSSPRVIYPGICDFLLLRAPVAWHAPERKATMRTSSAISIEPGSKES